VVGIMLGSSNNVGQVQGLIYFNDKENLWIITIMFLMIFYGISKCIFNQLVGETMDCRPSHQFFSNTL
jgi:hypothetical protein